MLVNVVIIAIVAGLLVLSLRSIMKKDSCSSCSSAAGCAAHEMGSGTCVAAQDMLARVEAELSQKSGN